MHICTQTPTYTPKQKHECLALSVYSYAHCTGLNETFLHDGLRHFDEDVAPGLRVQVCICARVRGRHMSAVSTLRATLKPCIGPRGLLSSYQDGSRYFVLTVETVSRHKQAFPSISDSRQL